MSADLIRKENVWIVAFVREWLPLVDGVEQTLAHVNLIQNNESWKYPWLDQDRCHHTPKQLRCFSSRWGAVISNIILAHSVDVWIHSTLYGRAWVWCDTDPHGNVICQCEDLAAPSGENSDCLCWTLVSNRLSCFGGENKMFPKLQIQPRWC